MNKGELTRALASRAGITRISAEAVIDALFGTKAGEGIIASELEGEGEVSITGFGKFHIRTRAARTGRNPRTGETIQIAAGRYPVFKAGKSLKDRVSG